MDQVELICKSTRNDRRKVTWETLWSLKGLHQLLLLIIGLCLCFSFFTPSFRPYGLGITLIFLAVPFIFAEVFLRRKCKENVVEYKLIVNTESLCIESTLIKWDNISEIIETKRYINLKCDCKPVPYIFKRHLSEDVLQDLKSILAVVPVENKKLYVNGKVLRHGSRPPIKWRYALHLLMFILGCAIFYCSIVVIPTGGMQRFIVPGEHHMQIDKSGSYHMYYEHVTNFNGKDFITNKDDYKKMTYSLQSEADGEEVKMLDDSGETGYNINNKRTGYAVLQFEIYRPGAYILKAEYKDVKQIPEIVLGVKSSLSGLMIILAILGLPIAGSLVLGSIILFFVTFLKNN